MEGLSHQRSTHVRNVFTQLNLWMIFLVLGKIGGTTSWKLGPAAAGLAAQARRRGLWVHLGRVNSLKRLRYA